MLLTGLSRIYLPRRWETVCASTEKDGKCVALQREIRRRSARGALRVDSLRLECHPRDRMFIRLPDILRLPVRRLRLIPNYPKGRAAPLCRMLNTDFGEHLLWAVGE